MIISFGPESGPNGGAIFRDFTAPLLGTGLVRGVVPKIFPGTRLGAPV
jgi:hypothetical protein